MQNTKQKIQTQLSSMMESSDLHTIKVNRLTDALGIGRGTFYMYYDSIYSVLQEIEDKFFDELSKKTRSTFYRHPLNNRYNHEPHPAILHAFCFLQQHSYLCRVLWGPHGCLSFQTRCKKIVRDEFFPIFMSGVLQHDLSDDYLELKIKSFVTGHCELVTQWLLCHNNLAAEKVAILAYQMMFQGLSEHSESWGQQGISHLEIHRKIHEEVCLETIPK
jgi:AcrR family transcriptional regulator